MWRSAILDPDNREYREAVDRAFSILHKAVTGSDALVEIPADPSLAAPVAVWSLTVRAGA